MKLLDINGKEVRIQIRQSDYPMREVSRSNIQHEVGQKLQEMFPHETILEEFPIPGSRMTLDYFMPRLMIAVEVDGEAHDHYIPFFHGQMSDKKFTKQVKNDMSKNKWCEINGIKLVRITKKSDLSKDGWIKN